jgi:hypothetical protein
MSKNSLRTFLSVGLLGSCGACNTPPEEPISIRTQGSELSTTTRSRPLRISLLQRSGSDAAAQVRDVLGVVVGGDVKEEDFELVASRSNDRVVGRVRSNPRVVGSYQPTKDEVDVTDLDVAADVYSTHDVGESLARSLANDVLRNLIQRGVVSTGLYDFANAHREFLKQGSGAIGQEPVVLIKEYRYFIPAKFDGIPINDGGQTDLGIRVSVHRSGSIAGVRISGLGAVVDEVEGTPTTHRVSEARLNARALSEFPNAEVTPVGLRYSLAPGYESEPVVATSAFRISPVRLVEGRIVHSRSMMVYYSVADPLAEPRVWPQVIGHEVGAPR